MQRKLIRVGTSAAVLIPKATLDELQAGIGDTVYIEISKDKKTFEEQVIDPSVLAWTEKLRKRYKPMLKKLASS